MSSAPDMHEVDQKDTKAVVCVVGSAHLSSCIKGNDAEHSLSCRDPIPNCVVERPHGASVDDLRMSSLW